MFKDFKEVKKFNKWMRKIHNMYYSDNDKMLEAFYKIESFKTNFTL